MPKFVDHEQRRHEVLAATYRVIERVGLEEATTRRIAEEAGYSNGVLAHYFADKDDILVSALEQAHAHVRARFNRVSEGRIGVDALRAVIEEALPLDAERLLEARIEFSFLGRALNSPRLRQVHGDDLTHFRGRLTGLVSDARAGQEIATHLTDEDVVGEILVLVDGLSIQALLAPDRITPKVQLRMLDLLLAALKPLPDKRGRGRPSRTGAGPGPVAIAAG